MLWDILTSPYQSWTSGSSPNPEVVSLTPHHLFYLLSRFEDLGIAIGPMNVRLENAYSTYNNTPSNYMSFLSKGKTPSLKSVNSTSSLHGGATVGPIVSGLFKSIGGRKKDGMRIKERERIEANLKYLYSAFTKIPCLKIAPQPRARLIEGYEEFPFDSAVPLLTFKNVTLRNHRYRLETILWMGSSVGAVTVLECQTLWLGRRRRTSCHDCS
jgi:hypothetical protein